MEESCQVNDECVAEAGLRVCMTESAKMIGTQSDLQCNDAK
jgi:hypothetical protein